jgi:Co/Zn/Cd efflux system component
MRRESRGRVPKSSNNKTEQSVSQQRRLGIVLGLNLPLVAAQVIVGLAAHSVGVLAAAGDTASRLGCVGHRIDRG